MKTFKYDMQDAVIVGGVIGTVVGRCEYSADYEPGVPREHTVFYCVRVQVEGNFNWQWYPEADVKQ